MTRRDLEHVTVCDRCSRGTWYETEQPCHYSYPKRCPTCRQTLEAQERCPGTLRVIDRSALVPAFLAAYQSGDRVRVRFASSGETLSGTVGRTSGWRPAYLLMRRAGDTGSMYIIGAGDIIVAVKRGKVYVQTYWPVPA